MGREFNHVAKHVTNLFSWEDDGDIPDWPQEPKRVFQYVPNMLDYG
jgi:hypothetical protein